jgi:purine-binding chemotaxis protein CheW
MRLKFGLGSAEYNDFTVVIILNLGARVVGMVVDSVSDVMELSPDQIRDTPEIDSVVDSSYITGLGTLNDRMLILIAIEKLMGTAEMALA